MNTIEIYVVCSTCQLARRKPYEWLREQHLPCPGCGAAVEIKPAHISLVDMQMADVLKDLKSAGTIRTVTLKI